MFFLVNSLQRVAVIGLVPTLPASHERAFNPQRSPGLTQRGDATYPDRDC